MLPVVPLEGRVTGEPQIKFTEAGKPVVRVRVKAADRRQDAAGKWVDGDVLWVTVTAFGSTAENVMESLVDGDQILAIGKWSTSEWMDQQGAKRSAPRFVAHAVGAGLKYQPRRHSAETMAKHRETDARPETDFSHGLGHRYADVAAGLATSGGVPGGDPWASDGGV